MIIKKKLNNNVAIVEDEFKHDIIVMGKGLAFNCKVGDNVDEAMIDKTFVSSEDEITHGLQEILEQIPANYLTVSDLIIRKAKEELKTDLNDNIYISLTDHIHMAVKRYLEGIEVPNPMLWDIKRFYGNEFRVAEAALIMIQEELKVKLPEDEAGFIAFHFVNARENFNSSTTVDIMRLVKEITNIIKYQLAMDFDEESVYYFRFITHIKFFAQRLFTGKGQLSGDKSSLFDVVKRQYKKAYSCTQSIVKFVKTKYDYEISEEEQLYLAVHIQNIIEKCKN